MLPNFFLNYLALTLVRKVRIFLIHYNKKQTLKQIIMNTENNFNETQENAPLFEFSLKKDGWYCSLMNYIWGVNAETRFTNMCPFFWLTIFNLLIIIPVLIYRGICYIVVPLYQGAKEMLKTKEIPFEERMEKIYQMLLRNPKKMKQWSWALYEYVSSEKCHFFIWLKRQNDPLKQDFLELCYKAMQELRDEKNKKELRLFKYADWAKTGFFILFGGLLVLTLVVGVVKLGLYQVLVTAIIFIIIVLVLFALIYLGMNTCEAVSKSKAAIKTGQFFTNIGKYLKLFYTKTCPGLIFK